jgi:hypothetical protein
MELLDREIVDSHQLEALLNQIGGAIRSKVGVVSGEIIFREKRGVACGQQNAFVLSEIELAELGFPDGAYIVTQAYEQRGTNELLEGNEVDRLSILEEVTGGVDMGAGMRAESDG